MWASVSEPTDSVPTTIFEERWGLSRYVLLLWHLWSLCKSHLQTLMGLDLDVIPHHPSHPWMVLHNSVCHVAPRVFSQSEWRGQRCNFKEWLLCLWCQFRSQCAQTHFNSPQHNARSWNVISTKADEKKNGKGRGKRTYLTSVVEKPAKNINLNMAGKDVAQKLLNSGRIVQALGVSSVIHLAVPKWLLHWFLLVGESSVNCWSLSFAFFFTYDAQQIQLVPHPHSWALLVYYRDDYLLVWYEC